MNPAAYDDFIKLNESVCGFASIMLKKCGEFYPFAAAIKPDGQLAQIGGDIGTEHPNPTELARFLKDGLLKSLADGHFRSFALCVNARVIPPNETEKVDALFIPFAHVSGDALHYYVAYTFDDGILELKKGFFEKPK